MLVDGGVHYFPSQSAEDAAYTSDRAAQQSPFRLLAIDTWILLKNLRYVPDTIKPYRRLNRLIGTEDRKLFETRDSILTVTLVVLEVLLLVLTVPVVVLLRGWMILLYFAVVYAVIWLIELPMWDGLVVQSSFNLGQEAEKYSKERWFFVNGIATSHGSLAKTCDRLSATFRRPIIGIHNRSFGIIGDVIECLIQRCFHYNTADVRCAYELLKIHLLDPRIEKVVVLAHSQGGILVSLALDRMFVELPSKAMSKLEIYTFGSAAASFNNPVSPAALDSTVSADGSLCAPLPKPGHIILRIEHYCNEFDLVPRWGVLYQASSHPQVRYAGRVFVFSKASGHLFNEHYLDVLFPLNEHGHATISSVLDAVAVDEGRDLEGAEIGDGQKHTPSSLEDRRGSTGSVNQKKTGVVFMNEGEGAVPEGTRRTVKQLSRLWMYVGGGEARSIEG